MLDRHHWRLALPESCKAILTLRGLSSARPGQRSRSARSINLMSPASWLAAIR